MLVVLPSPGKDEKQIKRKYVRILENRKYWPIISAGSSETEPYRSEYDRNLDYLRGPWAKKATRHIRILRWGEEYGPGRA